MDEVEALTLNEVAVLYSKKSDRPAHVGGLNACGLWIWPGAENTIACFSSKTFLFFGGLRIRALRLRGIREAEYRSELVGVEEGVSRGRYVLHCLRLLTLGIPLGSVGEPPVRLLNPDKASVGGTFELIAAVQR